MLYLWLSLFAAGIVAADQITKYFTVTNIPLYGFKPFLPGLLRLTYVQNTGGGWSILSDHTWLLTAVSALFCVFVIVAVAKKWFTGKGTLWCLFAVLGGAVGNMIDRIRLGYVVDMLKTEFMEFPVFNVADCFISVGTILLCLFVFLEARKEKSGEGKR